MTSKFNNPILFCIFISFIITIGGCGGQELYTMRKSLSIPIQSKEKIPMKVGLYLSPQLTSYVNDPGPKFIYKLSMGDILSEGCQYTVRNAFEELVTIYTIEPGSIPEGLDALVIPEIDKIYIPEQEIYGARMHSGPDTTVVKMKWSILSSGGEVLYRNTFTGESKVEGKSRIGVMERVMDAYTKAAENHFSNAFIGITSTKWWEGIRRKPRLSSLLARWG